MNGVFPIIVRVNETGDLLVFSDEKELQYLERIDVDNGEYQGWNSAGLPCELSGDSKGRISVRLTSRANQFTLDEAIEDFAVRNEFHGESFAHNTDRIDVINTIWKVKKERHRSLPLHRRILDRF